VLIITDNSSSCTIVMRRTTSKLYSGEASRVDDEWITMYARYGVSHTGNWIIERAVCIIYSYYFASCCFRVINIMSFSPPVSISTYMGLIYWAPTGAGSSQHRTFYFAGEGSAKYCLLYCLSLVCLSRRSISKTTRPNFTDFCVFCPRPWLRPPVTALRYAMYFRFCG